MAAFSNTWVAGVAGGDKHTEEAGVAGAAAVTAAVGASGAGGGGGGGGAKTSADAMSVPAALAAVATAATTADAAPGGAGDGVLAGVGVYNQAPRICQLRRQQTVLAQQRASNARHEQKEWARARIVVDTNGLPSEGRVLALPPHPLGKRRRVVANGAAAESTHMTADRTTDFVPSE